MLSSLPQVFQRQVRRGTIQMVKLNERLGLSGAALSFLPVLLLPAMIGSIGLLVMPSLEVGGRQSPFRPWPWPGIFWVAQCRCHMA